MDRQKIHLREEYNVKKPIFRNIHKIISKNYICLFDYLFISS